MEPESNFRNTKKTLIEKVIDREGQMRLFSRTKEDDDNVIDIEDYFDKDDMARGGIVSI